MADELKKARRVAEKLNLGQTRRHLMICCDTDEKDCASKKQMKRSKKHLKKRLKELGVYKNGVVRVTPTQCLDVCRDGPVGVVYPEGTWYGRLDEENLDRVIEQHLIGGEVVEDLVIARADPIEREAVLTVEGAQPDGG